LVLGLFLLGVDSSVAGFVAFNTFLGAPFSCVSVCASCSFVATIFDVTISATIIAHSLRKKKEFDFATSRWK
jgi:hypothetical protein